MSQPLEEPVPEPAEALSDENLSVIDLDTVAWQPPSRRKHLVRLALLVLIVAVALATLWRATPSLIGSSLAPTPIPPLVEVTLLSNVNFGTLLVNGHALAGHPPLTVMLPSQGRTVMTLTAPPFRPQSCTFTDLVPPQNDRVHCQLPTAFVWPSPQVITSPWAIGVYLASDDLSPGQQSQVRTLLSQWLGGPEQTTVPPGDYYATSLSPDGLVSTSQRATSRLRAQATFEVSPGSVSLFGVPNCDLCPIGLPSAQSLALASQSWGLLFSAALRWQFTDASGATLSVVSFPTNQGADVILAYDPATGWQVSHADAIEGSARGTECQVGIAMLQFTLGSANPPVPQFTLGSANPPVPLHDRGVEGCELGATINGVDAGRYVWRFGVLLAADAQAEKMMPALSRASPAEIAAVGG